MKKGIIIALAFFAFSAPSAHAQVVTNALVLPLVLTQSLSHGMISSDVILLQQFLRMYGYFTYPTNTGYFGAITHQAVVDFQIAYGISPVGIAGPITRAKIAEFVEPFRRRSVLITHGDRTHEEDEDEDTDSPDVDTEDPTVSITDPEDGIFTRAGSVSVAAVAEDNVGVVSVQFQVDGVNVGFPDTTSPYGLTWVPSGLDGERTLTAIAVDEVGNTTVSEAVTVTLDRTNPVVAFNLDDIGDGDFGAPADSVVRAEASDNIGVTSGSFYMDGQIIGSAQAGPLFEVAIDTALYSDGVHELSFTAHDAAGNSATTMTTIGTYSAVPVIEFSNPRSNVTVGDALRLTINLVEIGFYEVEDDIVYMWKIYREGFAETPFLEGVAPSVVTIPEEDVTEGPPFHIEVYMTGKAGNQSNTLTMTTTVVPPEDV